MQQSKGVFADTSTLSTVFWLQSEQNSGKRVYITCHLPTGLAQTRVAIRGQLLADHTNIALFPKKHSVCQEVERVAERFGVMHPRRRRSYENRALLLRVQTAREKDHRKLDYLSVNPDKLIGEGILKEKHILLKSTKIMGPERRLNGWDQDRSLVLSTHMAAHNYL